MLIHEYDSRKRKIFPQNVTVGEILEELKKFPPEASFYCCGSPYSVLHATPDRMTVSIDHDVLHDAYDATDNCAECHQWIDGIDEDLPVYINLGLLTEYVVCHDCFESLRDHLVACPNCGEWYEEGSIPTDLIACPFCGAAWEDTPGC